MPRLSEPGPLGMRPEHWYDFGVQAGNSNLFVQVVAHIAAASVPHTSHTVSQYLKAGEIAPLTALHDVLSPQTCSQISHGSQERNQ